MQNPANIALPQGVRDILPEEAEKITKAEAAITSVLRGAGYKRVITPLLEYVDVLSLGIGEDLRSNLLKFIDPVSGKVMAIRPDITPQVARLVSSRMKDSELPLKLYYNESVLRYGRNRTSEEVMQIGVEYVSKDASPAIDAEMVVIAAEALKKTGIKKFKIDLGDVGFVKKLLTRVFVPEEKKAALKAAIAKKDSTGIEEAIAAFGPMVKPNEKKLLMALPTLFGAEDAVKKAMPLTKGMGELKESLDYMAAVLAIVKKKGYKEFVTVDLGEVRGLDYYTGIIFEAFASGLGEPIMNGGRYDTLLMKYGYQVKSTGFAFNVGSVVKALGKKS